MNTTSTNDTYGAARVRLHRQIIQLQELLNAHGKKQSSDPANWAKASDLNHVSEILNEAIEFLGGRQEESK